jgi:hypothetical protein
MLTERRFPQWTKTTGKSSKELTRGAGSAAPVSGHLRDRTSVSNHLLKIVDVGFLREAISFYRQSANAIRDDFKRKTFLNYTSDELSLACPI